MKQILFTLITIVLSFHVPAQDIKVIPYPSSVSVQKGSISIPENVVFRSTNFSSLLSYFNTALSPGNKSRPQRDIDLSITGNGVPGSYRLSTLDKTINISGTDTAGVMNGLVTLLQLCKTATPAAHRLVLPRLTILDTPRYGWRGVMLDESRHFFGRQQVEQLLDWMAFYKLNKFHWHLTDANGWRIEIKKYSLLTSIGGRGNFSDSTASAQYYTQKEIRDIVEYAGQRGIAVIPEIDMPGHATAANHAYPQFSGGFTKGYPDFTFNPASEETYTFITDLFRELLPLFPAHIIHMGGDEVALGIKAWAENPTIRTRMKELGYTDLTQMEHYFLRRVADSLIRLGGTLVCWDEAVTANLPVEKTIITWWRHNLPETLADALGRGYHIILCPRLPMYFDFVQDSTHRSGRKWGGLFNSYLDVYDFPDDKMAPGTQPDKQILGTQANLWTETVASVKRLQFLLFPRIAALAEAAWSTKENKSHSSFDARLKAQLPLYDRSGLYYYDPFDPDNHPEPIDISKH
ncbi:MAG TPA: beta-N-acetylhexosaminidase [Puia sp.]|nr:beta-N-acetylhexosaminidase [Puia sp.]